MCLVYATAVFQNAGENKLLVIFWERFGGDLPWSVCIAFGILHGQFLPIETVLVMETFKLFSHRAFFCRLNVNNSGKIGC